MKLYQKLIRPMHSYPGPDYSPRVMPIEKEIKWYPEEEREYLEKKYASYNEGSFSDLVFEERFEPYAFSLLKEQEPKPPVHIHEEYPEHDYERKENGDIDDFAWDGDYHNGPMCKRCYYSFCVLCDPNGWDKKQCIIDEYKCPKCGMYISKGTKFCSDCGQEVKWE